jgi:hypothetical protein
MNIVRPSKQNPDGVWTNLSHLDSQITCFEIQSNTAKQPASAGSAEVAGPSSPDGSSR